MFEASLVYILECQSREGYEGNPNSEIEIEAEEIAQWSEAPNALPEGLGSVLGTHIGTNNHF